MSLFPAYSTTESYVESQSLAWLQNESCPPEVSVTSPPVANPCLAIEQANNNLSNETKSEASSELTVKHKKKKKSKKHKSKKYKKKKYSASDKFSSSEDSDAEVLFNSESRSTLNPMKHYSNNSADNDCSDSSKTLLDSTKRKKSKKRARSKSVSDKNSISSVSLEKKLISKRSFSSSRNRKSKHQKKSHSLHRSSKEPKEKHLHSSNICLVEQCSIPDLTGKNINIFLQGLLRALKPEEVIFIDEGGDKNNTIFANTHYSQVAKYSKWTPFASDSNFKSGVKKKSMKSKRYFSKSCRILPDSVCLNQSLQDVYSEGSKEYIPIKFTYEEENKITKTFKEKYDLNYLKILDPATEAYLLGKAKSINSEENNIFEEGNSSEQTYWKNKVKDFNEKLACDPNNISLWLEFLNFQDKAFIYAFSNDEESGSKRNKHGKNAKQLVERKLSILDSAIKKNIRVMKLQFERLNLGQEVWEHKVLNLEWNKLVSNFPNNMEVWHRYLIFHQTYFPTFNLQNIVQAFGKCSERLVQMRNGTFLSHKPPENIGFHLIDLTTHLAFVWYQGGFMERSIALFQALIEFNLFSPPQLLSADVDAESKLAIFEAFWDSKAARFGEKESVGWTKFMERKEPVLYPEEILEGTQDEEDEILGNGGSKSKLWIELESSRELNHWSPWQRDPDDCEDLERMVSFSDIKRHVYSIQSEEEIFYLILQFLQFLGVTIPQYIKDVYSLTEGGTCLFNSLRLESLKNLMLKSSMHKELQDEGDTFNFPVIGPSVHKMEPEEFFEFVCRVLTQSMNIVKPKLKSKLVIILIRLFTERCSILKQCDESLFLSSVKNFKSKIKNLLKEVEFRSDLEIYLEYAKFEKNLGLYQECSKIHIMTLGSSMLGKVDVLSFDDNESHEIILKHLLSIIKLELKLEEKTMSKCHINTVINIVSSLVLDNVFSYSQSMPVGANVLKARRKLHNIIETKLKTVEEGDVKFKSLSYAIILLVILQLFTNGFEPACLIIEQFIENIGKISEHKIKSLEKSPDTFGLIEKFGNQIKHVKEPIYENYFWLIETVPKLNHIFPCLPMSPSSVRSIIKAAIKVAPNNVNFLEKLVEYQNWRDILGGIGLFVENDSSLLTIIYRLLPHIKNVMKLLHDAKTGVVSSGNQLESILQSAVTTSFGRNCPLLWRLYLRLTQVTKPRLLKSLAYRAIDSCPSAKCLYMDCVRLLPNSLPEILKLMNEKGLRVRMPLEELDVLLENELEEELGKDAPSEESFDISKDSFAKHVSEDTNEDFTSISENESEVEDKIKSSDDDDIKDCGTLLCDS